MDLILTNTGTFKKSQSDEFVIQSNQAVYEVIRIIDGIPLFLNDHFDRFMHSMQIQDWKLDMEFDEFKFHIQQLIQLNHKETGNIKFEYFRLGEENSWLFRFIPHSYPTADEYMNGVSTDLLFDERKNPNAKVVQTEIREKSNQMISDRRLYEVLLVDKLGMITEGSRSNVFFVKDDIFYTAPSSMVLVGITCQKVIECMKNLNFSIVEEAISASRLEDFDAAFLTGTSPKILPIRSIGNLQFETRIIIVHKLIESYENMIDDYLGKEKSGYS